MQKTPRDRRGFCFCEDAANMFWEDFYFHNTLVFVLWVYKKQRRDLISCSLCYASVFSSITDKLR